MGSNKTNNNESLISPGEVGYMDQGHPGYLL